MKLRGTGNFAIALAVSTGLSMSAAAQEITIRAGITDPLETPHGQAMVEFKRVVEEETGGRIEVQLFPSNQLGTIVEQIANVRQGSQEMSMSTPAWFSQFYPKIDMLEMPFLVVNWDQAKTMLSSEAFEELVNDAEEATNIRIIGAFPYGFRNVINSKHPVESLEDLEGLKLRLQNSPVHLATFRALGAIPVAIDWNEVYQAVQTGVVDGLENSNNILLAHKFYEVAPYISNTRHFFGTLLVYANTEFYNGLSEADQAVIDKAMRAAEAVNLKLSQEAEAEAVAELEAKGAEVNDLSPEALEDMRAAVEPVYEEFAPKFEPLLSKLQEAVN